MKVCAPVSVLLLASCSVVSTGPQGEASGPRREIDVLIGQRYFGDGDLEDADVDEQLGYGIEFNSEVEGWPVGWEVGFSMSSEEGDLDIGGANVDTDAEMMEIYGGARKTFEIGNPKLRPYVGGGLSWVDAEFELSGGGASVDDDDSSIAFYVHGGVTYDVAANFTIGADLRWLLGTDMDFFDESVDVDYTQIALVLGYSF